MKVLKTNEIKTIRDDVLKQQDFKCAICGKDLRGVDGISLDHQHKLNKSQELGDDGAGLIRGVLCRECNVLEGKIWNNGSRYKQFKSVQERIIWLQKLINYYSKENYDMVHPSEKPIEKDLSKRQFNKLQKMFSIKYPKKKVLEFPKSRKLTKKLDKLFKEFNINPYNEVHSL